MTNEPSNAHPHTRLVSRLIAWSMLLGSAIGAFVLAVVLVDHAFGFRFTIANESGNPIENWTLALLTLSIALSILVIRLTEGLTSLPGSGISLVVLGIAVVHFLFGTYAFMGLAICGLLVKGFFLNETQRVI